MTFPHKLVSTILFGLAVSAACAQDSAQPTPTIRVQSRIVLLDISVTDKAGHPVTDLRQDEFRVTEQKVTQQVLSFEPPSAHAMPPDTAGRIAVNSTADLAKIGDSAVTILVLDELNMDRHDAAYAHDKLVDWLARQPAILPQPVALSALTYSNFDLLRDFTQDRDALLTILKKHSAGVLWRSENNGTVGAQASENMFTTLGALERVSQVLRGVPGRKNLIWVGNGFPSTNFGDTGRTDGERITDALHRLSNVMLHARVTLSVIGATINPSQEVRVETDQDAALISISGSFDGLSPARTGSITFGGLAPPTGGHAFAGRNDLDVEIAQAVNEGQSYYSLSYRPSEPNDNPKEYRKIAVSVTRPGLVVQTRDGYFGEPKDAPALDKNATQQLAFDLNGAAFSQFAYTDLHMSAEHTSGEDYIVHASAKDMTWRDLPDGRRHADLVIMAACFNNRGKMIAKPTYTTLGSNTEASLSAIGLVNAALHVQVVAPIGTARIRFVVRDMNGGRVGTADYKP